MKIICRNSHWAAGIKDPDLTKGKKYEVVDPSVIVMGAETMISVIGDRGEQVDRPRWIFCAVRPVSAHVSRKRVMAVCRANGMTGMIIAERILRGV